MRGPRRTGRVFQAIAWTLGGGAAIAVGGITLYEPKWPTFLTKTTASEQFTTRDGRKIVYDEIGDVNGQPILFFPGVGASKYELRGLLGPQGIEKVEAAGLRIITIDRPGCGDSIAKSQYSFQDISDDAIDLIQALGLESVGAIGYSSGAAFALAFANRSLERGDSELRVLALVSGGGPYTLADAPEPPTKNQFWFALKYAPILACFVMRIVRLAMFLTPEAYAAGLRKAIETSEADRHILPALDLPTLMLSRGQAIQSGVAGVVREFQLLQTDAPPTLKVLASNQSLLTHIWHGTDDDVVPTKWAEYYASILPNSVFHAVQGQGHRSTLISEWSNIVEVCRESMTDSE